jgi:hypothetical protein
MESHYLAYGLHLKCPFELLGVEPCGQVDDNMPMLTLTLCDPAEIDSRWSDSAGAPEWRGRLGDGLDLTIERGSAEDRLFAYGDRARFLLHADMRTLDCAPRHEGLAWQRALITKILPAISVMRGYEGLHAAAIESPAGVVAIMAPSGAGKSTLASELLASGWPLFADDVLILDDTDGTVTAYPGTPHMNVAEHAPHAVDASTLGSTLATFEGERWLAASATSGRPLTVRMLCLLQRGEGLDLRHQQLPSSPLLLAPYMLGLAADEQRQRSRFCLYADLMQSTPLVQITAGLHHRPDEIAAHLRDALGETAHLTRYGAT